MDLTKFDFPEVTGLDMAFSTLKTDKALLEEAKKRGFYNAHTRYNDLFNKLFFGGGNVVFKDGLDPEFRSKAWAYCKAFMTSFEPKHEEKEAIAAMLMSELIEPPDEQTVWEKLKKEIKDEENSKTN